MNAESWFLLLLILLQIITAGLAAWGVSYLRQKGKNYATKEDVAHLTRLAEEVKTELAGKAWVEQRRWDLKRDLYFEIIKSLEETGNALARAEFDASNGRAPKEETMSRLESAQSKLFPAVSLSGIFLSAQTQQAIKNWQLQLTIITAELRGQGLNSPPKERVPGIQVLRQSYEELRSEVIKNAKGDLMLEIERGGGHEYV